MKKFILAALFTVSSAFAAEVTVLEARLPMLRSAPLTDARFHIDMAEGQGYAQVSASETVYNDIWHCDHFGRCFPRSFPTQMVIFRDTVKIENLVLEGDQVIYRGEAGDVNCGRMGRSRLGRLTFFLSGKCELRSSVSGNWSSPKMTVKFITK